MFDSLEIFNMARSLAEHAASRQSIVSQNIANADTPGYKQRDIQGFADIYAETGSLELRNTREGHSSASTEKSGAKASVVRDAFVEPNGNSVSLEDELVKAAANQQSHEMALSVYRSGVQVIRSSLGRH